MTIKIPFLTSDDPMISTKCCAEWCLTPTRAGRHQAASEVSDGSAVTHPSDSQCCATHPHVAVPSFPWATSPALGLDSVICLHYSKNGCKSVELALPLSPAKLRSRAKAAAVVVPSPLCPSRSARLALSFHLHSGKLKMEQTVLL